MLGMVCTLIPWGGDFVKELMWMFHVHCITRSNSSSWLRTIVTLSMFSMIVPSYVIYDCFKLCDLCQTST